MIILITDYGHSDPYVGQLKLKIHSICPSIQIIDLMHGLPKFNIDTAAILLPTITPDIEDNAVILCIVDPGVGGNRKPIVIKADQKFYIGPDNGVFDHIIKYATQVEKYEIKWKPESLSISFHGRDLFAPIAARIACDTIDFNHDLQLLTTDKQNLAFHFNKTIIYFDHFGNAVTGINKQQVSEQQGILINEFNIEFNLIFSSVKIGKCFCYINSMGLLEISCNQGSAKDLLQLQLGMKIELLD